MSLRENTEMMIPSHKEIKNSAKRTTGEVNFFARSSRALGTGGETHNHTGARGDSAILVPSWTSYDDKFKYSAKQANGSVYELDEEIMNEMVNVNNNFSEGLETVASDFIHNNRSGVNISTAEGTFNAANDAFEITEAFDNLTSTGYRFVQIMKSNLRINKWSGPVKFYCDTLAFNKIQALANNGAGNSINTSFQIGADTYIHSPELDAKAAVLLYTKGYVIAEPDGNSAVLDWQPIQNRQGLVGPDGRYGMIIHPVTGLPLATHEYTERADESASNGDVQDLKTEVQIFTYLSLNGTPLTTTDETVFYAFALV